MQFPCYIIILIISSFWSNIVNKIVLVLPLFFALPSHALTFSSQFDEYIVPDRRSVTVDIIVENQSEVITDFNSVSIFGIEHLGYSELSATISNSNNSVTLFSCGREFLGVCPDIRPFVDPTLDLKGDYSFSQTGADWYSQTSSDVYLPQQEYESYQDLSIFEGQSLNDTWSLTVSDSTFLVAGTFNQWSFSVNEVFENPEDDSEAVVFEFTPTLGIILVGGYFLFQRNKRFKS